MNGYGVPKILLYCDTPVGRLGLGEEGGRLTHLFLPGEPPAGAGWEETAASNATPLLKEAAAQLTAYMDGKLRQFDLPLAPAGTDYQKKVWEILCTIPYGEVRGYRWLAEKAGNSRACRAVGTANRHNPLPIFIPCHRVIATDGRLTGYAGGLERKAALLRIEGVVPDNRGYIAMNP